MTVADLIQEKTDNNDEDEAYKDTTDHDSDSEDREPVDFRKETDNNAFEGQSDQLDALREQLQPIQKHETAVERFAKQRDDRLGAAARYFVALSRGEEPAPPDCEVAGLPKIKEIQ